MGRKPKELMPATSAMHYFGAEVRRLRQQRGLSQRQLAEHVLHGQDLVRKIESADRSPSQAFVERCDETLGADGSLLRLWPMVERERILRSTPRSEGGYSSELTDRPVLDWLLDSRGGAGTDDANFGLAADFERLQRLRRSDQENGAGETYPQLSAFLSQNLPDLGDRSPRLAARFLELAGYDAVDLGADGLAQRYYLRALGLAASADDRSYGAYLIAVSLGHLALHVDDALQAVRLADAAARGAGDVATPAVRAAMRAVAARAHARLGNEASCTEALDQVEADLGRSNPSDEPDWIRYFGEADLADEKAHCFFDLGQDCRAQQAALAAIRQMDPSRVRRLAMDRALYASALARQGEIEAACAVGRQAVDDAARTTSFRSAHRVALMMAELHGHAAVPAARGLVEYAAATLPPVPVITRGRS